MNVKMVNSIKAKKQKNINYIKYLYNMNNYNKIMKLSYLKNEYINIDIISYSSKILVLFRFERF